MKAVKVYLLDCGQGNCAFIRSGGTTALLDARVITRDEKGKEVKGGRRVLDWIKQQLDGTSLDYLVISHPHEDHIQGLAELFEEVVVQCVVDTGLRIVKDGERDYPDYDALLTEIGKRSESKGTLAFKKQGDFIRIGDANLLFLTPDDDYRREEGDSQTTNRRSAVVSLEITSSDGDDRKAILFLADSLRATFEEDLANSSVWEFLTSNVVVAAHHGSRYFFYKVDETDYRQPYTAHVERIAAEYTFVSCDDQAKADEQPPHEEAIDLYEKHCGTLYRSDEDGSCRVRLFELSGNVLIEFDAGWEMDEYGNEGGSTSPCIITRPIPQIDPAPKGYSG